MWKSCENVMNIAFLAKFWFNLPWNKILERSNFSLGIHWIYMFLTLIWCGFMYCISCSQKNKNKNKKESCSQKQEEELGYFLKEMTCPQCFHNCFTTNHKW